MYPQGARPPGPMPSGLPPHQRPPADYRPPASMSSLPNPSNTTMNTAINKMTEMNLNSSQQETARIMSNGFNDNISTPSLQPSFQNENRTTGRPSFSTHDSSSMDSSNTGMGPNKSLDNSFGTNSNVPGTSFGSEPHQESNMRPSFSVNSSSPMPSTPQYSRPSSGLDSNLAKSQNLSQDINLASSSLSQGGIPSALRFPPSTSGPNLSHHNNGTGNLEMNPSSISSKPNATSVSSGTSFVSQSSPGITQRPAMLPTQGSDLAQFSQGMPPRVPGMHLQEHGIPPRGLGMPPQGPGMPPQGPGMPLQGPGMPLQGPGMPLQGPGMPLQGLSMPLQGPSMPLQGPSMPPQGPGMAPQGPGMAPQGPGMPPQGPGMPPQGPGMRPQGPGMPPQGPGMRPQGPGMRPQGPGMRPQGPGMPPQGPGMPPQGPGMPPQGPGMPPPSYQMADRSSQGSSMNPQVSGPPAQGSPMMQQRPGASYNSPVPGMLPSNPPMTSPRPGMTLQSPSMMSLRPGMNPQNSPVMSPRPGMTPDNSSMISPRLGMTSQNSPMNTPRAGFTPQNPMMTSSPGMASQNFPMIPPRPGMPMMNSPSMTPRAGMMLQGSPRMGPQGSGPFPPQGLSPLPSQSGPYSATGPPTGSPMMNQSVPGGLSPSMPNAPPGMQQQQQGGMQNRYPGSNPAGGYQQSQGRRLNPDDMPSPLKVMEEDQQAKSGEFLTVAKGTVPPLVTTDYFVRDGGAASPRFIRSTMYSVPATPDMMKQASVPFGLIINPFAELHPQESPLYCGTSLTNGPVRCNRCKAYMSPFMVFMNGGRRFQCLLCKQVNEVPPEYHCHMDSQGARADKFQRPELCLGSYEYVATAEYCKEKTLPKEPAFIFVMEMSNMMMQRGIINLICQNMKSLLQYLPKEGENEKSSIKVGFITYDSSVHFYKLSGLAPEMCIVCDKEDIFVPVPDGVLCDVEEVADNIDRLMECIPQNFHSTRETSGSLYGAIQAGMSALKASGRSGKLFVFHSSLPVYEGPGKLKNREDRKVLGSEKEKAILTPQNSQYNNLAQELVSAGCGVDLFVFNESYIDLATVGQVARLTGGQCHKYTYFQPNKDSVRFIEDLKINLSRNIAFEAVMRVRTSTGVRPVEFFGHFFMSNTQDIELACIDSNQAVGVEVKHDDKITDEDGVYVQVAVLYTSVGGQRRLRIHNTAFNICTQLADVYKHCELDGLMNFFGKQSMFKFLDTSAKQVKENLIASTAQILACYRKNCATPSSAGQLILPDLMKLLPLYVNCLTKCDALSGGPDISCDDRSWHIYQLTTMTCEASVAYLYPRLVSLTDLDPEGTDIPPALRTSFDKLNAEGVFLLENGLFMFMWVGSGVSQSWMNNVFEVAAPHQLDPALSELPELNNPTSHRVRDVIKLIREQRRKHMRMFVVPQQGKHEIVMKNYLVEDKGALGGPSYVDFLCHVHKEIRALLS